MAVKFPKLRYEVGRLDYEWLLEENERMAKALAEEVSDGGDPEEIYKEMKDQFGETRPGRVNRIRSAAYYLQGLQK
jgi:hypothetical protein